MATPETPEISSATQAAIDQFSLVVETLNAHMNALEDLGLIFLSPGFDLEVYIQHTEELRKEYVRRKLRM